MWIPSRCSVRDRCNFHDFNSAVTGYQHYPYKQININKVKYSPNYTVLSIFFFFNKNSTFEDIGDANPRYSIQRLMLPDCSLLTHSI